MPALSDELDRWVSNPWKLLTMIPFPLSRHHIDEQVARRLDLKLFERGLVYGEHDRPVGFMLAMDDHINVPTMTATHFPLFAQMCTLIVSVCERGRVLHNAAMTQELIKGFGRAAAEREARDADIKVLAKECSSARVRGKGYKRKQDTLHALRTMPFSKGLALTICFEDGYECSPCLKDFTSPGQEMRGHGLVQRIDVRRGQTTHTLTFNDTARTYISGLERVHQLPACFRALPQVFLGLLTLCRTHHRDHGLETGSCYYSSRDVRGLRSPRLLLEACGYHALDGDAAVRMRAAVQLLTCITVTSTHGAHTLTDVPLVAGASEARVHKSALPEGVRGGAWRTLHLHQDMVAMLFDSFVQVPRAMLLTKDTYTFNAALHVLSRHAYSHSEDRTQIRTGRWLFEGGLCQLFRSDASREWDLLQRAVLRLGELGMIVEVTEDDAQDTRLTWQAQCTAHAPELGEPMKREDHEHVTRSAPVALRRRAKVRVKLTPRVLYQAPEEDPPPAPPLLL